MKIRNLIAVALTLLFVGSASFDSYAGDHSKEIKKECVVQPCIQLEAKELLKVDDAEYTVGVISKSNLATRGGYASEGIRLSGLASMLSLFKGQSIAASLSLALTVYSVYSFLNPTEAAIVTAAFPAIFVLRDKGANDDGGEVSEETKLLMKEMSKKNGEAIATAVKTAVDEAKKGMVTSEELKQQLTDLGVSKEQLKKLDDAIKAQGGELTTLKLNGLSSSKKTIKETTNAAFTKEKMDRIKAIADEGSGSMFLLGKEDANKVGNINTGVVSTDTGGNAILDLINADDLASMNLQSPFIENFASVTRTSKPTYTYADYKPNTGDAGFTAEEGAKSQMDLKLDVKTVGPKKATGYEILSEEAIQDIPRLQSEASSHILKKVLLKRQNGIIFGDGTGNTPIGVVNKAKAFDPATWSANPLDKVKDPNLFDCIMAAANQIFVSENYTDEEQYFPNVAFLNPKDLAAMKLKKNEFGMYLFPQLQLGGKQNAVEGLQLVAKKQIPVGKLLIGDFTKLRIINYIDYTVRMGFINDQMIHNLFTMLGETRFFTVIKSLDEIAFVYDDISDIAAGIAEA